MIDPDELPAEVREALFAADGAPDGAAKVALWESAVARADAADLPAAVRMGFRVELVRAAASDGVKQYDRAFVPWAALLAEADRSPDAAWVDWYDLLWTYKWMCEATAEYAGIPRAKTEAILDDFAARAAAHGYSPRPAENYRAKAAWLFGDDAAAAAALARFEAAPRDAMSDCHACELAAAVRYAVRVGDDAGAVDRFRPLAAGRFACAEEPEATHSSLLAPLVRLGECSEAAERHRVGLAALRKFPQFVGSAADHLDYLTRLGETGEAAKLLRRTLRHVPVSTDLDRWRFLASGQVVLEAVAAESDKPQRFTLPAGFPVADAGKPLLPSELAAALGTAADALEARFDARNGNAAFARRRAAGRAFAERAD